MKRRQRVSRWASLVTIAACLTAIAPGARAQSSCGATTILAAGESLADVAERCDVTLEALRDANPELRGEIAAGTKVAVPDDGGDLLARAQDLLRDAGREIEDAAKRAGKSVSDYLSGNPDVGEDIRKFGRQFGLPGSASEVGANITITPAAPRAGEAVTLSATGLRARVEAEIGLGPTRSEYDVVARATTDSSGRVEATVTMPDWVDASDSVVFVVETENVRLTSDPVPIVGKR